MKNFISLAIAILLILPLAGFAHEVPITAGATANGNTITVQATAHKDGGISYMELVILSPSSLAGQKMRHYCGDWTDCSYTWSYNEGNTASGIQYNINIYDPNGAPVGTQTIQLSNPSTGGSSQINSRHEVQQIPVYTPAPATVYNKPVSGSDNTPSILFGAMPSGVTPGNQFLISITSESRAGMSRITIYYPSNSNNAGREYSLLCGSDNPCTRVFGITETKPGTYTYNVWAYTNNDISSMVPFTVIVGSPTPASTPPVTPATTPPAPPGGGGAPAPTPSPGSSPASSSGGGGSGAGRDAILWVSVVDANNQPVEADSICIDRTFCVSGKTMYAFNVQAGKRKITVTEQNYMTTERDIDVAYTDQNITMMILKFGQTASTTTGTFVNPTGALTEVKVTVSDIRGPVENAQVTLTAPEFSMTKFTDSQGKVLMDLREGSCYAVIAEKAGARKEDRLCVPAQKDFKINLSGFGLSGVKLESWAIWLVVALAVGVTAFFLLTQMGYIGYGIGEKSLDGEETPRKTPLIHDLNFNEVKKPAVKDDEERRTDFFS